MNAVASPSILDRVTEHMRACTGAQEQAEVVAAFPGEPANVVRLTLGALRRQLVLDCWTEGGKAFYMFRGHGGGRAGDAAPLRQAGTAMRTPPGATKDTILLVMQDGKKDEYSFAEVIELSGLGLKVVRKYLQALVNSGRIFAKGSTQRRRYSLKPFPEARPLPPAAPSVGKRLSAEPRKQREPDPPPLRGAASGKPEERLPAGESAGDPFFACPMPPDEVTKPRMLVIVDKPEPMAAITADGEILILDGCDQYTIPRRRVRAIARLIRSLDTAGLLDG